MQFNDYEWDKHKIWNKKFTSADFNKNSASANSLNI